MDNQPGWLTQLWQELEALEPAQRVKVSGDTITYLTHFLLPELATYRREQVVQILAGRSWDARKLAETIGARPDTMNRLAREWRRAQT